MGQVGRFAAVDAVRYPRHSRVVLRTRRGLEIGEVLSPPDERDDPRQFADGEILRGMTVQDELLCARLEKHRQEAYQACSALLAENGQRALLVDVEHLFDGQGLFFYFLGEVSPVIGVVHGTIGRSVRNESAVSQIHRNADRGLRSGLRHGRSQRPRRLRHVQLVRRIGRVWHEARFVTMKRDWHRGPHLAIMRGYW